MSAVASTSSEAKPRTLFKGLVCIEALPLLGPVSVVWVLGVALLPTAIGMLVDALSGGHAEGGRLWTSVSEILVIVSGVIGLFALIRILLLIGGEADSSRGRTLTRIAVCF